MTGRLQRRFVLLCTAALITVMLVAFVLITVFNVTGMNNNLDLLAENIYLGGGRFPDGFEGHPPKGEVPDKPGFGFISPETRFSTRHFSVSFNTDGSLGAVNVEFIHSVTEESAVNLAEQVIDKRRTSGWLDSYRYNVFSSEGGICVVFIDGGMTRASCLQSVSITAGVLITISAAVVFLVVILSKRAIKPIADAYERQKQFVTDANHELKTPLTLILANLDIAEAELGKNEWLEDIRDEGERMVQLVNQLVSLSRMDEDTAPLTASEIPLDELVEEAALAFTAPASAKGVKISTALDNGVTYLGDDELIRRLVGILLDNAVKYCDPDGLIRINLESRRQVVMLTVENTYSGVESLELEKLFDRFYRADKARSYTGGYGIGLSIAATIVERHRGSITAYRRDNDIIGFKVVLKQGKRK